MIINDLFNNKKLGVAEGWGGALAGAIGGGMIGGPVGAAVGGIGGYVLGGGNPNADLPDDPESAYELGQQAARNGETEEDNPYEEEIWGADDAGQAWHDGWTDAQDDEDDAEEQPQVMPTKQASVPAPGPTKISGSADFSKLGFTNYKKESVEQDVAEKLGDHRPKLGNKRDAGKSVRKWRDERGLDEMDAQNFVGGMTASYQQRENQPIAEDYIDEQSNK